MSFSWFGFSHRGSFGRKAVFCGDTFPTVSKSVKMFDFAQQNFLSAED